MLSDREARVIKEVADARLRDGHFRDAVEQYSQALGCAGDAQLRSTLLANRCLAMLRAGRLEDALCDAQSALQLRPRWHKAHLRLAQCKDALRQTHAAIASYKRALELEPGLGESVSRALASLELKESRSLCRLSLSARHAVYGVALHPQASPAHPACNCLLALCHAPRADEPGALFACWQLRNRNPVVLLSNKPRRLHLRTSPASYLGECLPPSCLQLAT